MSQMNAVPIPTDLWGLPWWSVVKTLSTPGLRFNPWLGELRCYMLYSFAAKTRQTDPQCPPKTNNNNKRNLEPYLINCPVHRIKGPHWASVLHTHTIACLLPKNFILANSRPHGRAPVLAKHPGSETASHFHTCSEILQGM